MRNSGTQEPAGVVVAVAGQGLAQEAISVVAATGYEPLQVTTPDPTGQVWRRAGAVLTDVPTARLLLDGADGDGGWERRDALFVVHDDGEDPDLRIALELGAEGVFALPSEGADVVERIGRPGRAGRHGRAGRSGGSGARATGGTEDGGGAVIAVTGAVGGAGTSVVAAACAACVARARQSTNSLLIDADELSGGVDLLLGIEHEPGLRWPDIRAGGNGRSGGSIDADALSAALPTVRGGPADSLAVVTGPRSRSGQAWSVEPEAVWAMADSMVVAGGTAVIDLPRNGVDLNLLPPRTDVTALVVPASVRGVAAAARQAHRLKDSGADPVMVLVLPEAGGGIDSEDAEYATGVDVVATVPFVRQLGREIEATGLGGRKLKRLMDSVAPVVDLAGELR